MSFLPNYLGGDVPTIFHLYMTNSIVRVSVLEKFGMIRIGAYG